MDKSDLPLILLSIVDRLSNDDRQKLHFILAEHLPRRIADDTSHQGTLSLMKSLLDQNKINEINLTLLINALESIHRSDLVKFLKGDFEHLKQNSSIKRIPLSTPSMLIERAEDRDENDQQKSATVLKSTGQGSTDFTILTSYFVHFQLNEKSSDDNDHMCVIEKDQSGFLSKFQFILIDIVNRFDEVSLAMLKALQSMIKESLLICPDTSVIDLDTLPEKTTFLFVSSEVAEMIMRQNKQIGAMFILENDPKKVDDEMRFGSGLD